MTDHHDWIIIGSGFGGSVSGLRLVEKGWRVLMLEKGRRFSPEEFPKTNWNLRNWMWRPSVGLRGFFQMSFLKHITVLHGVGVGGGSLVYANTLPIPPDEFFEAPSWGHLANWKDELTTHYETARRMLGAVPNPLQTRGDQVLAEIASDMGRSEHHRPTHVGVFFGEPGVTVSDPFFDGKGPDRVGCTHCGACMTGCRVGAKNTLDRNYLFLAEQLGLLLEAETEVTAVRPRPQGGYLVETRASLGTGSRRTFTADRVIFSGGVMGTMPLLLAMKDDSRGLPKLSPRLGDFVRTNNESLLGVVSTDTSAPLSTGVAITSILHTDDHSHVEPVRYGAGSGFFRLLALPHAPGSNPVTRLLRTATVVLSNPKRWLKALFTRDFARHSQVLLYMRTLDSTLRLRLGRSILTGGRRGLVSQLDDSQTAPQAFLPEATELANKFADKTNGVTMSLLTETLLGVPSTAHILGGACMGATPDEGAIDANHKLFGYEGLYVIDGSAISANPGVNPSLTITAMAERAMTRVTPAPTRVPSASLKR